MNGRKLCPRIILMTDGKPTDENGRETQQVRTLFRASYTSGPDNPNFSLSLSVLFTRARGEALFVLGNALLLKYIKAVS